MALHVSQQVVAAKMVSGLKKGEARSLLVDGDLTSATAAKAAVDTDVAKLHVSERHIGARIKASIDKADSFLSGYTTSSDVSDYDVMPANTQFGGMDLVL